MFKKLWPQTRKSHPLSKLLRPLFEGKKPKNSFGILLVAFIFLSGIIAPAASAFEEQPAQELTALEAEIEVKTEFRKDFPFLDSPECYLSQDYWYFHPANDIACPQGTEIHPVLPGRVINVGYDRFGYGNKIIIEHEAGRQSLYAHLTKINVQKNQEVTQETAIGQVGATGWATGNHLHLEIQESGEYLNPRIFLNQL